MALRIVWIMRDSFLLTEVSVRFINIELRLIISISRCNHLCRNFMGIHKNFRSIVSDNQPIEFRCVECCIWNHIDNVQLKVNKLTDDTELQGSISVIKLKIKTNQK